MLRTDGSDGGPAYPSGVAVAPSGDAYHSGNLMRDGEGMSLRDWFAGQAISTMLVLTQCDGTVNIEAVAAGAYDLADAMLAERSK